MEYENNPKVFSLFVIPKDHNVRLSNISAAKLLSDLFRMYKIDGEILRGPEFRNRPRAHPHNATMLRVTAESRAVLKVLKTAKVPAEDGKEYTVSVGNECVVKMRV